MLLVNLILILLKVLRMKKSLIILVTGIYLSSFANAVNIGNGYDSLSNVKGSNMQISKNVLLLADGTEDCSGVDAYTPECQFGA